MAFVEPVTLSDRGIELVPLGLEHEEGLRAAAMDGELWRLRITSVPEPDQVRRYIEDALQMREAGNRFAFVVRDQATGTVLGSSSYHDILANVKRVEIGYTWYAKSSQRTHVNTTCKLLLMGHAFDTLGCHVVGWQKPGGLFDLQKPGRFAHVQCENCHSYGGLHARTANSQKNGIKRKVTASVCAQCHRGHHHPDFQYNNNLHKILGKGHGEALWKKLLEKQKK